MRRRIALIIPYYDREFFIGVGQYAGMHHNWRLDVFKFTSDLPSEISDWPHDGLIVQLFSDRVFESLMRSGKPAVNVSDFRTDWGMPSVYSDNPAIGRMAARHLLEKGFGQMGFFGYAAEQYSRGRRDGFLQECLAAGAVCSVLEHDSHQPLVQGERLRRTLRWLEEFPKPVGVVACNDMLARYLVEICLDHGVSVPEQVAVIGVDNSPVACNLVEVPISSVVPDTRRIGFEAAQMLHHLLEGDAAPTRPVLIPPIAVEPRQSSDVIAVDDPDVVRALTVLRSHLADPAILDLVVAEATTSRRSLERRFRLALGRSIMDEVVRERLERAKRLLRDTDWPMMQIAAETGFASLHHLARTFRRLVKMSPSSYRRRFRPA